MTEFSDGGEIREIKIKIKSASIPRSNFRNFVLKKIPFTYYSREGEMRAFRISIPFISRHNKINTLDIYVITSVNVDADFVDANVKPMKNIITDVQTFIFSSTGQFENQKLRLWTVLEAESKRLSRLFVNGHEAQP